MYDSLVVLRVWRIAQRVAWAAKACIIRICKELSRVNAYACFGCGPGQLISTAKTGINLGSSHGLRDCVTLLTLESTEVTHEAALDSARGW